MLFPVSLYCFNNPWQFTFQTNITFGNKGPVVLQTILNNTAHLIGYLLDTCWSVVFSKVCGASARWYLADSVSDPVDVLLLTGRSLSHDTSGRRPAASYRDASDFSSSAITAGRAVTAFAF